MTIFVKTKFKTKLELCRQIEKSVSRLTFQYIDFNLINIIILLLTRLPTLIETRRIKIYNYYPRRHSQQAYR